MRILIDLDDVVDNLLPTWVNELNKRYNLHVNEVTCWDITKDFPTLTENQIFEVLEEEDFWKNIKPIQDSIYYINKLKENHFIYFCTASSPKNFYLKYEYFLKKYFPDFSDLEDYLICIKHKQLIKADILIDDNINNLIINSEIPNYVGILFTNSHNKNINEKEKGLYRVNNWEECYNLIDKISENYFDFLPY
jgi:5'(3')-deoxyribonucleotidase